MCLKINERGLTLMELLILLAITAVLAALLAPVMRHLQSAIDRTVDSNNIRMIGQASLNYANDHGGNLPGGPINIHGEILTSGTPAGIPSINALAAALARGADLNDATVWISRADTHFDVRRNLSVVLDTQGQNLVINPDFNQSGVSFCYIANLNTSMPSHQPVAFTRGLQPNGLWINHSVSVYRNEGGHVLFLGGHVGFHPDLGLTAQEGQLTASNGQRTNNVLHTQTFASGVRIFSRPASPVGQPTGHPMSGPTS